MPQLWWDKRSLSNMHQTMTYNSRSNKKKITIRASPEGVEKAEKALIRLGLDSKSNFAKSRLLSRSTVTRFFNCQPIQVDTFKKICSELQLNWREATEISGDKIPQALEKSDCQRMDSSEGTEEEQPMQLLKRQVTVLEKDSQKTRAVITLEGDINSAPNLEILALTLQSYSGDTIKIIDIREGSIKITVEGSPEDIEKLLLNFQTGEVKRLNGFPVEDIKVWIESLEDDKNNDNIDTALPVVRRYSQNDEEEIDQILTTDSGVPHWSGNRCKSAFYTSISLLLIITIAKILEFRDIIESVLGHNGILFNKWRLVRKIVNQGARDHDLGDADLSDADLSNADLSGADLSNADLSGADLSDADLSNADLSGADLSNADLSNADLSGADLSNVRISRQKKLSQWSPLSWEFFRGCNLIGANLIGANLSGANLIGADLIGADLIGADLIGADLNYANLIGVNLNNANVDKARFQQNPGLTEEMKLDLKRRGAIFEDSPGDHSRVLSLR